MAGELFLIINVIFIGGYVLQPFHSKILQVESMILLANSCRSEAIGEDNSQEDFIEILHQPAHTARNSNSGLIDQVHSHWTESLS